MNICLPLCFPLPSNHPYAEMCLRALVVLFNSVYCNLFGLDQISKLKPCEVRTPIQPLSMGSSRSDWAQSWLYCGDVVRPLANPFIFVCRDLFVLSALAGLGTDPKRHSSSVPWAQNLSSFPERTCFWELQCFLEWQIPHSHKSQIQRMFSWNFYEL